MRQTPPAQRGLADLLRDGFDWLPIGVVMAAGDGAIVLVNRAFERLWGYGASELIGQPIEVLVPEATPVLTRLCRRLVQPPERGMGAARSWSPGAKMERKFLSRWD